MRFVKLEAVDDPIYAMLIDFLTKELGSENRDRLELVV